MNVYDQLYSFRYRPYGYANSGSKSVCFIVDGIQRALGLAGPILTHVIVSYDGREIRWLSALRSKYLDGLTTAQKARLAARVGVRTVSRRRDDD